MKIIRGVLNSNNKNITLKGNWYNLNSPSAFSAGTSSVTLTDTSTQIISGPVATTFNKLFINKSANNVSLDTNIQVNDSLHFASNTLVLINDNNITLGTNGKITGTSLGSTQMIQSNGTTSAGKLIKLFADGTALNRSIIFPIGVGSSYNSAQFSITGTFSAAQISVQLDSGYHPAHLPASSNLLKKYWKVATSGITSITIDTLKFTYQSSDVNGHSGKLYSCSL